MAKRKTARRTSLQLAQSPEPHQADHVRGVFCNRTLNLRSITAIGYDMDYTLVHYNVEQWEQLAYQHIKQKLVDQGWPLEDLEFNHRAVVRGLIIDRELGNILKANRFGYIKQARHGTWLMDHAVLRKVYGRTIIDLTEGRWVFLNTLFSLSEACMYGQLIDLLDRDEIPNVLTPRDLYDIIRTSLDETHMEGALKTEIVTNPDRYLRLDPDVPLTLLDQQRAGKKLLLITNSEWEYTRAMMEYAFDRFLPEGVAWRDLFHLVIVSARKPAFFSTDHPFFEVSGDDGLLRRVVGGPSPGGVFLGGNAAAVEHHLGISGDSILYVGDHLFSDVHVTKNLLRWRTALIVPELEGELAATRSFAGDQGRLAALMKEKEQLELEQNQARLLLQRKRKGYGPRPEEPAKDLELRVARSRRKLIALDEKIRPLAEAAGEVSNTRWGLLMRAGNDKSHMARQIERHADIYMSRVSNFMQCTPYAYFRSPRGSLPHDR
ncbi:MAG: HAD-IG family 5'-nucleotidase [Gemmatimonadetes bacterium]|nr:HAD-IG family 5'-nucleotidase [Gemmatimonadota bacterium]